MMHYLHSFDTLGKKCNSITQNWILHPNHDDKSFLFVETNDANITHTINMKHGAYTLQNYDCDCCV